MTTIAPTEPTGRRPATRRISTAGADLPTFTIGNVAAGLNTDWHHLCADAGVDHRVEVWPAPFGGPGASLEHTLALCGGDRTIDLDVADAHLATLVALAGHDDLAARVVLQRIVPGLVRAARRRRHQGGMRQAFDDVVANAWVVIRTYPLQRRPRRIAANLCRDAEYHAFVRPHRLRSGDEQPQGTLQSDRAGRPTTSDRPGARRTSRTDGRAAVMCTGMPAAADEVRALLADALLSGIDPAAVALVVTMHLEGRHPRVLATELAVSERTVRNRRDAVVRQLASLAA